MKFKNFIAVGLVAAPVAALAGPALNPRLCTNFWE